MFKKKLNLQLEISSSQEDKNNKSTNSANRNSKDNNILSYSSVEIQSSKAIFKKDGFMVGSRCIKNVKTLEPLTSIIDPKDIEIGDFIGSGASGSVHIATYKPNNIQIAVKSINLYDKGTRKQFKNDLRVLVDNKCQNLIRFYGAFFYEGNVKILLEYMNIGSLDRVIEMLQKKEKKIPCIPESILSYITYQILQGLLYLHKTKHLIHRDIKPANILINSDGIIKLTDFGISRSLDNTADFSHTYIGSKNFMSPERISGKEYSYPSDIWSLGLVLYELATGIYPYGNGNDLFMQITKIVEGPEPCLPCEFFSQEFCDFMNKILKKEPSERANVSELIKHDFIVKHLEDNTNFPDFLADLFDYMSVDQ